MRFCQLSTILGVAQIYANQAKNIQMDRHASSKSILYRISKLLTLFYQ